MSEPKVHTIDALIESIERRGRIDRSKFGLRPGLSAKEESGFDSEHGDFEFGSEVVSLIYADFDGQDKDVSELSPFGEFHFMTLKEAQQDWRDMFDACGRQKAGFHDADFYDERVKDGIRWRKNWFPFGIDIDTVRSLVIDFDPSPKGTRGQIIAWGSSDQSPRFLASSFAEFLQIRLNEMESSNFSLRDGFLSPIVW